MNDAGDHRELGPTPDDAAARDSMRKLSRVAALVAALGLSASLVVGLATEPRQALHSHLVAVLYFVSIAVGGLLFVLSQHVTRAGWSVAVRRVAEKSLGAIPVLALLFVPVLLGLEQLYPWADPDALASDPVLRERSWYQRPGFFTARAAIAFVLWTLVARWLLRTSVAQDQSRDPTFTRRLERASGLALLVVGLSATWAGIDWMMSLEPRWTSTVFGLYFLAGCVLAGLAFVSLVVASMRRAGLAEEHVTVEHQHDLGKLLLGFVLAWAYFAFTQYMPIWYAGRPEETLFYDRRAHGAWGAIGLVLMVGHFALPLAYLMSRRVKRSGLALGCGAAWLLLMHYVDIYYIVMPLLHPEMRPHIVDLMTFLGVGGMFLWSFGRTMGALPLVPVVDPRLNESTTFESSSG